ncbi:hypothetical protein D3C78_1139550 [compost metagenome]
MHSAGIGNTSCPGLPGLPAILGMEGQPIGACYQALAFVDEMHGQPGLVRPIGHHLLSTVDLPGIARSFSRCQLQLGGLDAVELHTPVFTAVSGMQHHAGVTDGPARVGAYELHRRQRCRHRHLRLTPAVAVVVGQPDYSALAHRHQAITGPRHIQQYRLRRNT